MTAGPTGTETLRDAARRLHEAGVPGAALDVRRLLAHALGVPPGRLTLMLGDPVPPASRAVFERLVDRRAAREPVSHLLGRRLFYGREFAISADVLDPRPETEVLVEAALAQPFERVLDLGTGSGCILLTLLSEMPGSRGLGVDLSEPALAVAAENAGRLDLGARARLARSDWFAAVDGAFDLIVANPPYIARDELASLDPEVRDWEPRMALTDEGDGLDACRAILAGAAAHLMPEGRFLMEFGAGQGAAVAELARSAGFGRVTLVQDLDGRDRVLAAEVAAVSA